MRVFLILPRGGSVTLEGAAVQIGRLPFDPTRPRDVASLRQERPRVAGDWLYLPDPFVSRRHALLTRQEDGGYALEDAGSTGGTFVNHVRIAERIALQDGDRLDLGQTKLVYCRREGYSGDIQPAFPDERWEQLGSD